MFHLSRIGQKEHKNFNNITKKQNTKQNQIQTDKENPTVRLTVIVNSAAWDV